MPFTIFFRSPGWQGWLQIEEGIWRTPPGHCIERTCEGGKATQIDMNGLREWDKDRGGEICSVLNCPCPIKWWRVEVVILYWSKISPAHLEVKDKLPRGYLPFWVFESGLKYHSVCSHASWFHLFIWVRGRKGQARGQINHSSKTQQNLPAGGQIILRARHERKEEIHCLLYRELTMFCFFSVLVNSCLC